MQTQILGLVTPLMALFFALIFVMLWHKGQMKRHVLGYGIAFVFSATGFLITHFLPADAIYLFHTTQIFYSLASVILLASVCERAGQRLHLGSMVVIYIISALIMAVTISFSDDVASRLVLVNMGYGVMFAMGVATLLTARRKGVIDRAIIGVMALQAVDFLVRPSLTLLFEQSIPVEVYRDSIYYSFIGLILGLKGLTVATVLIAATIAEWTSVLRKNGERDSLTGLNNRGSFEQSMTGLIARSQTEGSSLSLVVADIDFFKKVNDIWGHQAGDQAIANFGSLINGKVRSCDIAGRIGGEEFCIAVWNCDNEPAYHLAERIRQAFASHKHSAINDDIRLTASFGVATAQNGETYKQLFARADKALYEAKSNGRNRVVNAEVNCLKDTAQKADLKLVELEKVAVG